MALWRKQPELVRIVVAVNPPATSGPQADECGIVVAGVAADGHAYVMDDRSMGGLTPLTWASRAAKAFRDHEADRIVAESNQGGEAGSTLVGPSGPVTYWSPTALRLTATGGNFAGGKVRLAIHYLMLTEPGISDGLLSPLVQIGRDDEQHVSNDF